MKNEIYILRAGQIKDKYKQIIIIRNILEIRKSKKQHHQDNMWYTVDIELR